MRSTYGILTLICYLVAWTASLGHVHLDGVAHSHEGHHHLAENESAHSDLHGHTSVHSHCRHHSHGDHHHGLVSVPESSDEQEVPVHHHHDGEDCQLCHHIAQAAVTMSAVELVCLDAPLLTAPELSAEIYACFVAISPSPRGPPAGLFA